MGAALAAPIAAVAVLVALACLALARPEPAPAATSTATLEQSFLGAVNRQRLGHGRRPVRLDSRLRHAARFHSRDMVRRHYFAHGDFADRIASFGAPRPWVGEALGWIAASTAPVQTIVDLWMHSPEHRAVLLRPGFSLIGVGVARGPFMGYRGTIVVTADFSGW